MASWSRWSVVAGAVAAPLALAATALSGSEDAALVVRDERGHEVVRAELPASGHFALAYRHSYYDAPARELFAVRGDELRLRGITSPSAAVLDYYALAGERRRRGGWLHLVPTEGRRYERIPLIATATGRRTLLVGGERIPLYARGTRHLSITAEGER
jgi:Domain of unknown function (DUF1850)